MSTQPRLLALVPARAGSKRVRDKNVRPLAGHPLLAYTIAAARASGAFGAVVLSTDSELYACVGRHYGAEVPFLRPPELATDTSPDIDWVEHALAQLHEAGRDFDAFSILRPTSPFRLPETIRRARSAFLACEEADSLRAVEKCAQHPAKMWVQWGALIRPLVPLELQEAVFGSRQQAAPWHSSQYQALPEVFVQNASLEIAWSRVVFEGRTIAGNAVLPFFTAGHEGFDVNHPSDWRRAEELVASGEQALPQIAESPFQMSDDCAGVSGPAAPDLLVKGE